MNAKDMAAYILNTFEAVETSENYGFTFFFYGSDHTMPFATLIGDDTEYDRISNLSRDGVYRLNIGINRATFQEMFGADKVDVSGYDFTALDTIMPHPDYSAHAFVCVLSPGERTLTQVQGLLAEAHGLAARRFHRKNASEA